MLDPQGRSPAPSDNQVLVVEDDLTIALLIAAILEDAGYQPVVVRDGRKALRVIRELRPVVITLDLELPDLDGRAVLQRLMAERATDRLPVVVVSGSTELLSREERRSVSRALTKPFDLTELIQAVDEVAARGVSGCS
ncbi:MAG: response regulator [Chloroflexi bacterium]|nr:response regulator [Chloroflexota bacterium]